MKNLGNIFATFMRLPFRIWLQKLLYHIRFNYLSNESSLAQSDQTKWFVFTIMPVHTDLIYSFLEHYEKIGFTDCVVFSSIKVKNAENYNIRVHYESLETYECNATTDSILIDYFKLKYAPNPLHWIAVTDIDEFHKLPCSLSEIKNYENYNVIMGTLVDKVTPSGELAPIPPTLKELEDTFSKEVFLTEVLTLGSINKVMLYRGHRKTTPGHHSLFGRNVEFPQKGKVHHYKWNYNILQRSKERKLQMVSSGKVESEESQRVINHVQKYGKINLKKVSR